MTIGTYGKAAAAAIASGAAIAALGALAAGPGARETAAAQSADIVAALIDPARTDALLCRPPAKAAGPTAGAVIMAAAVNAATAGRDAAEPARPPLWQGLGTYSIAISTPFDAAQRYFDQGLRFVYAFNHAEAVRAFRAAQEIDPECAMCYWGEALALGPNINAGMETAAVAPAFAAIAKAALLAPRTTEKERALIAALAQRYAVRPDADRRPLDKAYADAMRGVAATYPDDDNVQALFAEALMDLQPWNYWEADGRTPRGNAAEIVATLERVLARNPDHAASIHLYIHMVEASGTPERAKPFADRLGAQMPAAGHIVHMPSHIYFRLGLWKASMEANIAAVKADEAYLAAADADGIYPSGYFPHNIHFVVTSAQMGGAAEIAVAYADKLAKTVTPAAARAISWVQPIMAAPYFAHVMFSPPETILALPEPAADIVLSRALWHYARAQAQIARGDIAAALREREDMRAIAATGALKGLVNRYLPAPTILAIADNVLAGRLAMKAGDYDAAVAAFRAAAEAQDTLPYMEPPFWYYPVRQSLGAALLRANRPQEAATAFRAALNKSPNNGWALFGLAEAYAAAGDDAGANAARALFDRTWLGGDARPEIDRL